MIYFLLSKSNSHTISRYLSNRGRPLNGRIGVIHYQELPPLQLVKCSALIFSDLDIIDADGLIVARNVYDEISKQHPKLTIFNNPHCVKLRYSLLRSLHTAGINPFNVYRPDENISEIRYPVFVRRENDHIGALTPLIKNRKSLNTHLLSLEMQGWKREQLLIVEYEDVKTSDGYYIRYAALRIGDELFPYLIDYDQQWVAKYVDTPLKDEQKYASAFKDFAFNFEDKRFLMSVFDSANIDYGRVDYSYYNGKPVIWEINLNPDYEHEDSAHKYLEEGVRKVKRQTNARILSYFKELDERTSHYVQLDEAAFEGNFIGAAPSLIKRLGIKIINKLPIKKEMLVMKRAVYLFWARIMLILKSRK